MSHKKPISLTVRIPAKVMLSGEYAVMEGGDSLSFALNKYQSLTLEKREEGPSKVVSCLWEKPLYFSKDSDLDNRTDMLSVSLRNALREFPCPPFFLSVRNDFSVQSGFGSSSALRLALYTAIFLFSEASQERALSVSPSKFWSVAKKAYGDQLEYQSKASGYDLITQKVGSLVLYKRQGPWPESFQKLSPIEESLKYFHFFVGGSGAPTKKVMKETDLWLIKSGLKQDFYKTTESLTENFHSFLEGKMSCFDMIPKLMKKHRQILSQGPHYPDHIEESLSSLAGFDSKWSFKTTGSGGEDALLFFGKVEDLGDVASHLKTFGWKREPWLLDREGLKVSLTVGGESYVF